MAARNDQEVDQEDDQEDDQVLLDSDESSSGIESGGIPSPIGMAPMIGPFLYASSESSAGNRSGTTYHPDCGNVLFWMLVNLPILLGSACLACLIYIIILMKNKFNFE